MTLTDCIETFYHDGKLMTWVDLGPKSQMQLLNNWRLDEAKKPNMGRFGLISRIMYDRVSEGRYISPENLK